MLDEISKLQRYIPFLLLIALIISVFYQITSAQSVRSVDLDATIIDASIVSVAIIVFVAVRTLYHIVLELGLALIIYAMIIHLVEEFYTEFTLVQTIHLSIVLFIGLILTLAGVRITLKKKEQDIDLYRVQKTELKARYTELAEMSDSLDHANKKNRLLTSLTRHDLLNQLTIVQSFNAIAIEEITESDPAKIQRYLSQVMLAGKQIEKMIRFTKEYEELGISAIGWQPVHQVIESSQEEIAFDAIKIHNTIPENLEIYADPIIRKVFTTLLDNSINHGGESMENIWFSCSESGEQLLLIYEDDGAGISPERKKTIFESLHGNNTGIGLFLSREILSITGLSICETGEYGKGVRFEIQVPAGKYRRR